MPSPLEPETRIGSYELVRRIGTGGMAEVWVARRVSERRTSKYVAIKVVADQHVGDPRFQRMFKAEVELSALLNHVNIVQVFDEGEDDGRSYLVMEWIDGVNLLKVEAALTFIDDEAWRLKLITYVVGQLLYALNYAHSITLHDGNPLGIVHRDVSPQNVLVSAQGEVKLTDFGVAHHLLEESSGIHVKGKLRYMAPEQLAGQTRDPRLDLYAVGAILHELLDGRRFRHHVEDQRDMYIEVISGKIPPLSRSVPPELDALRLGLLEPDVERRIPSADVALERLVRFSGYGDARRELTQLCGGLTGVMRPRVGPGISEQVPAAMGEGVGASRVEAPHAASRADVAASPATSASEPAAGVCSTLRMDQADGHEPIELEATQVWVASAIPRFVSATASAPIHATGEATDPAAPATAVMHATAVAPAPPKRARSGAAWVVAGAAVGVVLAGGAWWAAVWWPDVEGAGQREVIDERLPERPEGHVEERKPVRLGPTNDDSHEPDGSGTSGARDPLPDGSSSAGVVVVDGETSTGPSNEPGEPDDAGVPEPPEPPRPRPKQALTVVAVAAVGAVQVDVRSKDGSVRKRYELRGSPDGDRLPVGSYTVKWRPVGVSQWSKGQGVVLRRGCDLRVVIDQRGIKAISMGSACR